MAFHSRCKNCKCKLCINFRNSKKCMNYHKRFMELGKKFLYVTASYSIHNTHFFVDKKSSRQLYNFKLQSVNFSCKYEGWAKERDGQRPKKRNLLKVDQGFWNIFNDLCFWRMSRNLWIISVKWFLINKNCRISKFESKK